MVCDFKKNNSSDQIYQRFWYTFLAQKKFPGAFN